jgi:hypothetical protein
MSVVSNIIIYTGVDFQQTFTLENNDSQSALNLTGYTGCAKIKKYESSLTDTPFTVTFTDRLAGKVTISLSSTTTQNLKPGNYAYDFFIHDNSGNITKISEGQVFVKKSVTRI